MARLRRIADIIAEMLVEAGIQDVFMITGGGAMHLNDAIGRNPGLRPIFNHHEQACAMAAEAYCRLSGQMAALNVTTGPGGINALNGVHGAFTDSIAMIVISGQVKRETLAANFSPALRQLGDQEADVVSMARPVTKYATVLQDAKQVRIVMQKALFIARQGRPGPVWVDVPGDIQAAQIDEDFLPNWDGNLLGLRGDHDLHPGAVNTLSQTDQPQLAEQAKQIVAHLRQARRPVLMLGTGIRIAGIGPALLRWAERLGIPVTTAFNAHDLIEDKHPLYAGRPGTVGNRTGNFAVQNSDCLIVLGCRLNIRQISYNWASFAARAWTAHIDIDPAELNKPTLHTQLKVCSDLSAFLPLLETASQEWDVIDAHQEYLAWCKTRLAKYPVVLPEYKSHQDGLVNPYVFVEALFDQLAQDEIIVTANATATIAAFQAGEIKHGMRLFSNSGSASMGYDLPAAIGAAIAANRKEPGKRVICLAGDGSIMMNLQELQTIAALKLPIVIFLLNNNGYHSIRQTQTNHFPDGCIGFSPATGITFPDFSRLAQAFGLPILRIERQDGLLSTIANALSINGPVFCEVTIDPQQDFAPKLASRKLPDGRMETPALENMAPFLSLQEQAQNLI